MRRIRILLAKAGLDGHDRGAQVVALALRDAGMEVIYTGLHQSIAAIVDAAVQEDVDIVGLSVLSGAHVGLTRTLIESLRVAGASDKLVVVGGAVPPWDIHTLRELGVGEIFPAGTPLSQIAARITSLLQERDTVQPS